MCVANSFNCKLETIGRYSEEKISFFMLQVAGLLTQEQLSTIFLNSEELLENSQSLAEKMRDALDIATEQGDDDLLTVNIGKLLLDAAPMLHAFESYCIRQAAASLLLANMEKEKELLRIFLRVSQMENTVLRRMNLNSFLMVSLFTIKCLTHHFHI